MTERAHDIDPAQDVPRETSLSSQVLHCPETLLRLYARSESSTRRVVRRCGRILAAFTVLLVFALALVAARILIGPLTVNFINPYIEQALTQKFRGAYVAKLGRSTIALDAHGAALSFDGISLSSSSGQTVFQAPRADITIDPLALLVGSIRPQSIEIYDVGMRATRLPDGSAAISVEGAQPILISQIFGSNGAPQAPVSSAGASPISWIGAALGRILDLGSAADSPLGSLRRIGVARGKLIIDDQQNGQTIVFDDLKFNFDKTPDGAVEDLSALGPNGRWSLTGAERPSSAGRRLLDVTALGLSSDEVALALGRKDLGFDLDSPLGGNIRLTMGPEGEIVGADGGLTVGSGFFRLHDEDFSPLAIAAAEARFRWSAQAKALDVEALSLRDQAGSRFDLNGAFAAPETSDGSWKGRLGLNSPAVVVGVRPGEKPISIDRLEAAINLDMGHKFLSLDSLDLHGPNLAARLRGGVSLDPSRPHVVVAGNLARSDLREVLRLWPGFIGAPAHNWLIDHVKGGEVETGALALDFSAADLDALAHHHAAAQADSHIEFSVARGSLNFLPGMPSIDEMIGKGTVDGPVVAFSVDHGVMRSGPRAVTIVGGSFSIPNTDVKPAPATIAVHFAGALDGVADLIGREALAPYGGGVPIDTSLLSGQVDAQLNIDTKIGKFVKPSETRVRASAQTTDFVIQKAVGKESIDQATLAVTVDDQGLKADGQGKLVGTPAQIQLVRPTGPDSSTQVSVAAVFDDAARAKLGVASQSVTGSVGARLTTILGHADTAGADVQLDLTHAAIDGLVPGYVKPNGRNAQASFHLNAGPNGTDVTQLVYDGGPSGAKGELHLDAAGGIKSVRLTSLKVSPGDDIAVTADQSPDGLKIVAKGAVLDARPFLQSLSKGQTGDNPVKSFDLKVNSSLVTGAGDQALSDLALRVSQKNGVLQKFRLTGRFGSAALKGEMVTDPPGGVPQVSIVSADAGRLLTFTDLYRHVQGGALTAVMKVAEKSVSGRLTIDNFVVKDEPGLRRLVAGAARPGAEGKIDTNMAPFKRLQVDFTRTTGRIDLRDGSMYGQSIGTTLAGWLDFAHNRVDLAGTFVPAYGLNNLFSQIPVFGILLGGGAHEGLFGVNYRISGSADSPVLSINPLSAIAPGFLRKVFGAFDGGQIPAPPPQTPAADSKQ